MTCIELYRRAKFLRHGEEGHVDVELVFVLLDLVEVVNDERVFYPPLISIVSIPCNKYEWLIDHL